MSSASGKLPAADVVLKDGSTVHIRVVTAADEGPLRHFLERLDPSSRIFRFFSGAVDLRAAARLLVDVDYTGRYGLVATRGPDDRIVGQGAYFEDGPGVAEVAFVVADELQGHGLATILLAHLAEAAATNGISVFTAEVMAENHQMIEVFRESGFPAEMSSLPGTLRVELPTSFSADAVERFQDRDRLAAQAAVRLFLEPRSVAVIGASRERGTVGGEVFHNVLNAGFDGVVYPVNPAAEVVQAVRAYPSVLDLPDPVDLAVVTVPAAAVAVVARECAQREIPALVVISSGFAEGDAQGVARQQELVEICRGAGMRLVGPNCLGVLNTTAPHLDATFAPELPPAGNVGFVTQSGALGLALIELAGDRSLGVSSFASIGNRADITANDLLEYWEQDPATDVALLYIESFSDPRRFSRVAQRAGREMPVVVVKSGRSVAGERATRSHTGALLSASDVSVNALFDQAGVIRTDSLSEMLDVASLLANQPLPTGSRVGVVTNAGGPGIMCADACEAAGLEVPATPDSVQDSLRRSLAPEASVANPVDMIATAGAEEYRATIETLAAWNGIDALIVIFIRPLLISAEDVAKAVREAVGQMPREIPVQAVFMSARDHATMARAGGVPTYLYPEDAAKALARVVRHVDWRARPRREPLAFDDVRGAEAGAVIAHALESGEEWLDSQAIDKLLDCYGVATPASRVAADPAGAAEAARALGGKIALKAQGAALLHKSDLGAVRIGLAGGEDAARAAEEIDEALARAGVTRDSFLVQAMAESGMELLIGVVDDPVFGPVVACGAGGVEAELLKDVAVRVCPLAPEDAGEMLRSLALFPRLTGYRGAEPANLVAVEEMVLRVGALVDAHREIAELDLNPVVAGPDGALVVDARIRVRHLPPARPWPSAWKLGDP